jgi:hypothetical protein
MAGSRADISVELAAVQREVTHLRQSLGLAATDGQQHEEEGQPLLLLLEPEPELSPAAHCSSPHLSGVPDAAAPPPVVPSPRAQQLVAADLAALLSKASELLNRGQLLADEADSRAHSQAALAMYEAALALRPDCIDAQEGQRQAAKGVAGGWHAVRTAQRRTQRRPRGNAWAGGQIDFD